MDGDSVSFILVTLVLGSVLPFVSEYLNKLFKVDGKKALVVAGLLSGVVATGVLFFTGGLHVEDLQPNNLVPVFTAIFTVSQIVFQIIKKEMGWATPPNFQNTDGKVTLE